MSCAPTPSPHPPHQIPTKSEEGEGGGERSRIGKRGNEEQFGGEGGGLARGMGGRESKAESGVLTGKVEPRPWTGASAH